MLDLTTTVNIGGTSITSYVVAVERNHSVCDQVARGAITVSFECPTSIDPYDEVVVHELGTKVFTGYVVSAHEGRMPIEYIVEIADPAIKLQDYWLTQLYESSGESAEYWIGFFCDLADVSYQFDDSYSTAIPDDYSWEYISALEVVRQLIAVGGYHMISDPDGVIHFVKIPPANSLDIDQEILGIRYERSITPSRNQAIVFGRAPIAATATTTLSELSGREKTAVVATPYVETQEYAQTLADGMIDHFGRVEEVVVLNVIGDPDYRIGYYIRVTESWTGLDKYRGLITDLKTSMSNDGYTMELTLNKFCPYIWGYIRTRKLYASTHGSGVYITEDFGISWRDINGTTLSGGALYVRGIDATGDTVWAATLSGVYHTDNASANPGVTWEDNTPSTLPPGTTRGDFDWTDIEMMPSYSGVVFTVGYASGRVYLFRTDEYGEPPSWSYVEIY